MCSVTLKRASQSAAVHTVGLQWKRAVVQKLFSRTFIRACHIVQQSKIL